MLAHVGCPDLVVHADLSVMLAHAANVGMLGQQGGDLMDILAHVDRPDLVAHVANKGMLGQQGEDLMDILDHVGQSVLLVVQVEVEVDPVAH
jgi:hypothetical protein